MAGLPFAVAGKTGTAQTGARTDNGLFVCCAPASDPGIAVATVIERLGGGSYAALSAARDSKPMQTNGGEVDAGKRRIAGQAFCQE